MSEKPHRLYRWSIAALLAANVADAATSYGRPELNPLLSPSQKPFYGTSLAVKAGLTAGSLMLQRYFVGKNPRMRKAFTYSNFITTGVLAGTAAHNQSLPR